MKGKLLMAMVGSLVCSTIFNLELMVSERQSSTLMMAANVETNAPKVILPSSTSWNSLNLTKQYTVLPTKERYHSTTVSRGGIERTVRAINKKLDGKLANKGEVFVKAGLDNNVNPKVIAAISVVETTAKENGDWKVGSSKVLKECNNVGGINWTPYVTIKEEGKLTQVKNPYSKKGWYNVYPSVETSIHDMAKKLKWFYIDEGRDSIDSIGAKWAPTDDPRNGIAGMDNNSWPKNVKAVYEEINKFEEES